MLTKIIRGLQTDNTIRGFPPLFNGKTNLIRLLKRKGKYNLRRGKGFSKTNKIKGLFVCASLKEKVLIEI